MDFSKFDSMIDKKALQEQMDKAPEYDDVPAGVYVCNIDKMEIKETKKGDGLNFAVQMGITETINAPKKQDKRKIFFNRKIAGNKTSEKWNDGIAIKGVIGWVKNLLDDEDDLVFTSYSQFAEEILDIYQDICQNIEVKVDYKPDDFNPITIMEVYDK